MHLGAIAELIIWKLPDSVIFIRMTMLNVYVQLFRTKFIVYSIFALFEKRRCMEGACWVFSEQCWTIAWGTETLFELNLIKTDGSNGKRRKFHKRIQKKITNVGSSFGLFPRSQTARYVDNYQQHFVDNYPSCHPVGVMNAFVVICGCLFLLLLKDKGK